MATKVVGLRLEEDFIAKIDKFAFDGDRKDFVVRAINYYIENGCGKPKPVEKREEPKPQPPQVVIHESPEIKKDLADIKSGLVALDGDMKSIQSNDFTKNPVFAGLLSQVGQQRAEISNLRGEIVKLANKKTEIPQGFYSAKEIMNHGGWFGGRVLRNVQRKIDR